MSDTTEPAAPTGMGETMSDDPGHRCIHCGEVHLHCCSQALAAGLAAIQRDLQIYWQGADFPHDTVRLKDAMRLVDRLLDRLLADLAAGDGGEG